MQDDLASFLSFQIRRAAQSGDADAAQAKLKQYLELERQAIANRCQPASELSNLRTLPLMRAVQ
ncbi:MAG TPA: hypothetical protein V6C81_06665 [Planktothrix sp.]|jgi:hypothetical protein